MRSIREVSTSVAFLTVSRVIGIARELLIAVTFGFSKVTDLFFQATFAPTAILAMMMGPFTTAFVSRLASLPEAERGTHLLYYRRLCLLVGVGLGVAFVGLGVVFAQLSRSDFVTVVTTAVILAPAVPAIIVLGYASAASIASGRLWRASALLFVNNVMFVVGLGVVWAISDRQGVWLLPTAYTSAALIAGFVGWNMVRAASAGAGGRRARLPGLGRAFLLASSESSVFILTQFIVLALASHAGEGWASAATLAQRISLALLGLVIGPASGWLMLTLARNPQRAARTFGQAVAAAFLVLSAGAVVTVLARRPVLGLVDNVGGIDAESTAILIAALPSFAFWMVAMGLSMIVGRMMFAVDMGRLYVTLTILGYLIANAARLWFGLSEHFILGIAVGACVELVFALVLGAIGYRLLRDRTPRFLPVDSALLTTGDRP